MLFEPWNSNEQRTFCQKQRCQNQKNEQMPPSTQLNVQEMKQADG